MGLLLSRFKEIGYSFHVCVIPACAHYCPGKVERRNFSAPFPWSPGATFVHPCTVGHSYVLYIKRLGWGHPELPRKTVRRCPHPNLPHRMCKWSGAQEARELPPPLSQGTGQDEIR